MVKFIGGITLLLNKVDIEKDLLVASLAVMEEMEDNLPILDGSVMAADNVIDE